MQRLVSGNCTLAEGETLMLVLCNKYGQSLEEQSVNTAVGAGGAFTQSLDVNENDTCWAASNNVPKRVFWVHEGEVVQSVDLRREIYPRYVLPVILNASRAEAALNAGKNINDVLCDVPLVSKEEQRFVCRYDDYAAGEEDVPLCEIDNEIGVGYGV